MVQTNGLDPHPHVHFAAGEFTVRAEIEANGTVGGHPDHRKKGYGTAALRKARSQLAGYFPAPPMVVRTRVVTPVSSGEITARTPGE